MAKSSAARKPAPQPSAISIDRRLLLKALTVILPIIERRNTIPVLSGILVEATSDCLSLTTTNLDQQLSGRIAARVDQPCSFVLLQAHAAAQLVKLIETDDITLSFDANTSKVSLRAGAVDGEFDAFPHQDFPHMAPVGVDPIDLHFGGSQLLEAIDRVAFAISKEETRYYLNGIYLHGVRDPNGDPAVADFVPRMVTTDGHKLAMADVAPELAFDGMHGSPRAFGVIIPTGALSALRALAERGAVDMRLTDKRIEVEQDGDVDIVFRSALIDGTFPDYLRVIPTANPQHAEFSPAMVSAATKRVGTASHSKSQATRLKLEKKTLTLQVYSPKGGKVTETLELPVAATAPFEHGVNGRYLMEILSTFDGAVRYRWADAAAPLVIYSADSPNQEAARHLCVLMPMRV